MFALLTTHIGGYRQRVFQRQMISYETWRGRNIKVDRMGKPSSKTVEKGRACNRTRKSLTLSHEFSSIDLCPSSDDFTLSDTFLSSSRREGLLKFDGKVDILEEDRFDSYTPFLGGGFDLLSAVIAISRPFKLEMTHDFRDFMSETFSIRNDTLQDSASYDLSKGRLGSFDKCHSNIVDTECSSVWGDD